MLTGPNPTDRGKPGSKYHILCEAGGLPLAIGVTGANRHDSMMLERCSTGCGRCGAVGASLGGPDAARASCTRTRATTTGVAATTSAAAGSPPESPAAASRAKSGSGGIAGWSSAL